MFNTQNSENQILFSGTYFRPNKGMPSPPPSGVSMKESRPIRDKPVGYLQASLWTADAMQVDASLPPSGDDRKWVCCSQTSLYAIYKHAWPKQSVPVIRTKPSLRDRERLTLLAALWLNDVQLQQSRFEVWISQVELCPALHQTP